jgi:hypothetical protein
MRGMIQGPGWPVAEALIPGGTIIDFSEPRWAGMVPPINTQALDSECFEFMRRHYEAVGLGHLLGPPPPPPKRDLAGRTKSSALYRQPRFQLWGYFRGSIY